MNPKTALFFVAFLPQFIDPAAAFPVSLQFAILGIVVNLLFTLADLVAVMLAGMIVARLRRSGRMQRIVQKIGGSLLIGLGAHLAVGKS